MITLHTTPEWADKLADDIGDADFCVTLTAVSYLHARKLQGTPHARLCAALFSASARGRHVTVILPASSRNHPATSQNNSQAKYLHDHNVNVHLVPMPNLLHAKTALIDNRIAWSGSGNFTAAACNHNHELYMRTDDLATSEKIYLFHQYLKGL